MSLLVVSDAHLSNIVRAVTEAARNASTLAGDRFALGTIDPESLRIAAICAVQIATKQPVWPGSEKLVIPRPKEVYGVVEMAGVR